MFENVRAVTPRQTPERHALTRADLARAALARAEERVGIPAASGARAVPHLEPLFPEGLRAGTVTVVHGATSLLWTLTAAAMGRESWVAVVGLSHVGWAAAAEAGVELGRVVYVPRAGLTELAACVDAYGVVVAGAVEMTGSERRSLAGRIRAQHTTVLSAAPWPGARGVRGEYAGAAGCARGAGAVAERWIEARRTDVAVHARVRVAQQARALPHGGGERRLAVVS